MKKTKQNKKTKQKQNKQTKKQNQKQTNKKNVFCDVIASVLYCSEYSQNKISFFFIRG